MLPSTHALMKHIYNYTPAFNYPKCRQNIYFLLSVSALEKPHFRVPSPLSLCMMVLRDHFSASALLQIALKQTMPLLEQ